MKTFRSLFAACLAFFAADLALAVPAISVEPLPTSITVGASGSLTVTATGAGTLTYQWRKFGIDLPGQTSATLPLNSAQLNDAGIYSVAVTDTAGSTSSRFVRVDVVPATYVAGVLRPKPGFVPRVEWGNSGITAFAYFTHATDSTQNKVYAAGEFTRVGNTSGTLANRVNLVRFNADGTIDTGFNPPTFNGGGMIRALLLQADGKLVVAGDFFSVGTAAGIVARRGIVRLNTDGSIDLGFAAGGGANGIVYTIAPHAGSYLIGGQFTAYNGTNTGRVARIDSTTGALDTTFNTALGTGFNNDVRAIAVDPATNAIYVGGTFTGFSTTTTNVNRLIRLTSVGGRDTAFNNNAVGFAGGDVRVLAIQTVGAANRLLVGGVFTSYNGQTVNRMVRLDDTGAIDATMNLGTVGNASHGFNADVYAFAIDSSNDVYVGGNFSSFNTIGSNVNRLIRLNVDGTVDPGFNNGASGFTSIVNAVLLREADNVLFAGGYFSTYNNIARDGFAKVDTTGALDAIAPSFRRPGTVWAIEPSPGNQWLIGGSFNFINDTSRRYFARLNGDGSLDTFVAAGGGFNNSITQLTRLPDGRIMAAGNFTSFNSIQRNYILRLADDGTLDTTFAQTGTGLNNSVNSMVVQGDGRVLVGGIFTSYDGGTSRNRIARLNFDGTLDTTFAPGTGFNNTVNQLALQSDGKVIAVGSFTSIDTTSTNINGVARLTSTGAYDAANFNVGGVGMNANATSNAVAIPFTTTVGGDSPFIGGSGTTYNTTARNRILQLNSSGALVTTFGASPLTLVNSTVTAIIPQADGKVFLAGYFSTLNGVAKQNFGRLNSDGSNDFTSVPTALGLTSSVNVARAASDGSILIGATRLDFTESIGGGSLVMLEAAPVPAISAPPTNQSTIQGGSATFSVTGTGENLQFQWFRDNVQLSGATSTATTSSITVSNVQLADLGNYTVKISNLYGSVTSTPVLITPSNAAPVIGTQPAHVTATSGGSATLSVAATGTGLSYQWRRGGLPIAGQTGASLVLNPVTRGDADTYDVVINSGIAVTTSQVARLAVAPTSQPAGARLDAGFTTVIDSSAVNIINRVAVDAYAADGATPAHKRFVALGEFRTVNGQVRNRVARFNADGTLDASFVPVLNSPAPIFGLAVQSDHKVLVGGPLGATAQTDSKRLVRLNADGSPDTAFNNNVPIFGGNVLAIAIQPADNKIIAAGAFSFFYNGKSRNRIVRLNADGTLDESFFADANSTVNALALDAAGQILIGGAFTSVNGNTSRVRVARLNSTDGSLDSTFAAPSPDGTVTAIAETRDGTNKVIIGGQFNNVGANASARLARLTSTGGFDALTSFATGFNGNVNDVACQLDGKILVAGNFSQWNGQSTTNGISNARLIRLTSLGAPDATFAIGTALNSNGLTLALYQTTAADDTVLVGGQFTTVNNASHGPIARYNSTGVLDGVVNPSMAASVNPTAIAALPNGQFLVAGNITAVNDAPRFNLARYNANGTLDAGYNPGVTGAASINGQINALAVRGDGKVLIAGNFSSVAGVAAGRIARLNADGTLDSSFNSTVGSNGNLNFVLLQPDGKVLIGGPTSFTYNGGSNRTGIVRLLPDGSVDPAWVGLSTASGGLNGQVLTAALQSDGKILIGGQFITLNGSAQSNLARLNSDGSLDSSTFTVAAFNSSVNAITVVPGTPGSESIYVGGGFSTYGAASRNRIARLSSTGAIDLGFNPGNGANSTVLGIHLQEDNKIIIRGSFSSFNPTGNFTPNTVGVVRLLTTGALDSDFGVYGLTTNGSTNGLVVQDDGSLLLAGGAMYDGSVTRYSVARTVTAAARTITAQPQSITVNQGQDAVFSVTATGTGPITYQWLKDGNTIAGATAASLTVTAAQAGDAANYTVQVTNLAGTITSSSATLTVNLPPVISALTPSQTVNPQGSVTLMATINSTPAPSSIQWLKNGTPIPGAVYSTLYLGNVQPSDAGTYTVTATNSIGSTPSLAQSALIGGWSFTNAAASQSTGVITFLRDGSYFLAQDSNSTDGMEHGTYTWNPATGAFTMTARTDTNGSLGFVGMTGGASTLTVSGDTLTAGPITFTRVVSATDPSIGSWVGGDNQGSFCLTFLANGTYFLAEDGEADPDGQAGMERGTYTLNAVTGAFASVTTVDTNGQWGLSHGSGGVSKIFGDRLVFASGTDVTNLERAAPARTVLTVATKPLIATDPVSAAVAPGGSTTLSVTPSGAGPFTYQWRRNGVPISGATSATLPVTISSAADAAGFDVVVSSAAGSSTSRSANVILDSTVLDESFSPPQFAFARTASLTELLSDGSFLVSKKSALTTLNQRGAAVVRYLSDGTVDPAFPLNYPAEFGGLASEALPITGKFYAAVDSSRYLTTGKATVARFNNDGTLDPTFTPYTFDSTFSNDGVTGLALQSDGRLLVAGSFSNVNGTGRSGVFRLNVDGSLDTTFTVTTMTGGRGVYAMGLDAGGKILLSGDFTTFNGSAALGLVRLSANGASDATFALSGFSSSGAIRGIVFQSTGKIVLGGRFTVNGVGNIPFIRLNSDGSLDPAFVTFTVPTTGFLTYGLIALPGDKFAGSPLTLYVCNADGSLVPTSEFTPPVLYNAADPSNTTFTNGVQKFRRRSDGRYIITGNFTHLNGVAQPGVAALAADGTVQPFAVNETAATVSGPLTFVRTANGHTLGGFGFNLGGAPTNVTGTFADLAADGSPAVTPFSSALTDGNLYGQFFKVGDGRIFTIGADLAQNRFFKRLLPNGTIDSTLTVTAVPVVGPKPDFAFFQSDFKALIMTRFPDDQEIVNGESLRRINVDGSLDTGYTAELDQVAMPVRGTPLAGESVGPLQSVPRLGLEVLAVDATNRAYVRYPAVGGVTRLARLNPNGSRDTTFAIVTAPSLTATLTSTAITDPLRPNAASAAVTVSITSRREFLDVVVQPGGKLVVAGYFDALTIAGVSNPAPGLARLNADGSFDATFNAGGSGPAWTKTPVTSTDFPAVEAMVQQPDGRILLAGNFESYNGKPAPGLVRITANGAFDPTFVSPVTRNPRYTNTWPEMQLQDDGSVVLMGLYTVAGERFPRGMVRLLIAGEAPAFTAQPVPATVVVGGSATLSAATSGPGPFTYQWRLNGSNVPNANGPVLTLANVQPAQFGDYSVVVSNPFSSVTSAPATIAGSPVANSYLASAGFTRPQFRHSIIPARVTLGATSGKIYASWFNGSAPTGANQQRLGNVMRLNTDGTVDNSFVLGSFLSDAWAVAEQADGKVLVAGVASFESDSTGPINNRIWRFDASGNVDLSYHSPVFDSQGRYITLQPDGKLLVGLAGGSTGNGGLTTPLFRLNTDGSLDRTFQPPAFTGPLGTAGIFATILVDASGRIIVGGTFNNVNGQPRLAVARLNSDGSLDSTFVPSGYTLANPDPTKGSPLQARGLGFQTQGANAGKILVAGSTLNVGGSIRPVIRLNSNGSLDSTFVVQTQSSVAGAGGVRPRLLGVLPDDRFYTVSANVTRFLADGTIDPGYTRPVLGAGPSIPSGEAFWMEVMSDGRVIIPPGMGSLVNGTAATSLVRFTATGAVDGTFTPPLFQREVYPGDGAVVAGKLLTWGSFDSVNATPRSGLARFNLDGTLDSAFVPAGVANLFGVSSAAPTSDGGVLAATILGADGINVSAGLTRFTNTGAVDGAFVPDSTITTAASGGGFGMFMQPDNKAVIWSQNAQRVIDGGVFVRRVNVDGSLDTFTGPSTNYGAVYRDAGLNITSITVGGFQVLAAYPDGRFIAAATKAPYPQNATTLDWTVYRLSATGVVDGTFAAPTVVGSTFSGFDSVTDPVKSITSPTQFPVTASESPLVGAIPQANGSVIVYGDFTMLGGQPAPGIARLTSTGALDSTFSVGSGPELRSQPGRQARLGRITVASDGKYWVTGTFDTFGGRAAPGLTRLNADGSVDPLFATSVGVYPWVGVEGAKVVLRSDYDAFVFGPFAQSADAFPFAVNALSAPTPPSAATAPVTTATTAGGSASFSVVAGGTGPFTYQWYKDNVAITGNASALTATLNLTSVSAGDAASYKVTITGPGGAFTTTPVPLTIALPPTITAAPLSQAVSVGQSLSLHVSVSGTAPFNYEWRKGGTPISGAANSPTFTINTTAAGDAGNYTVNVSNAVGNVTSTPPAVITILTSPFSATHQVVGTGYVPGATITISNQFAYTGDLSSLTWTILVPPGWKFVSGTYPTNPAVEPDPTDPSGSLSWLWSNIPASGSTFTYTLSVPGSATGSKEFAALTEMTLTSDPSNPIKLLGKPDPLIVPQLQFHDADTNGNQKIDVSELSRVITLYNARFTTVDGKIRTGAYSVAPGGLPDGFAPDPARDSSATVTLTRYHSADTNRNGKIDVSELSRVITLYNTRFTTVDGKIRTGFYLLSPGTLPDGFAPDPTRAP